MKISFDSKNPLGYQCAMPNCDYSSDTSGRDGGFFKYDGKYYCHECLPILQRLAYMARWKKDLEHLD